MSDMLGREIGGNFYKFFRGCGWQQHLAGLERPHQPNAIENNPKIRSANNAHLAF
jgi:hypothetical protein